MTKWDSHSINYGPQQGDYSQMDYADFQKFWPHQWVRIYHTGEPDWTKKPLKWLRWWRANAELRLRLREFGVDV